MRQKPGTGEMSDKINGPGVAEETKGKALGRPIDPRYNEVF